MPGLIAFLAIYATLLIFYKPNLLFSATTTAGGDTGAYHYPMQYLIQYLLPHFKLTGWAPGWYAGMPMFTFYFPFPFLLIALLHWIIPYTVAFKIVTVLGVFALPAAAYAMARLWRVRRPYPVLAAVFALVFLLMQSYSIYGGNILSTLAGEFSFMLSFSLVFLFLGTVHRGMQKSRFDMLFVLNGLILMTIVLCHVVPTMALVCIVPGLLIVNRRWRALGYLAAVAAVGFALSAFWTLPFLADLQWSAHMSWNQLHGFKDFLPTALLPVAGLGFVGMAYAVARKEIKLIPLAWATVAIVAVALLLPNGRLWNARLLPFWYFALHLWAAYGVTWLIRPFSLMVHDLFHVKMATVRRIYVPLVAIVLGVVVIATSSTAMSWIKWNYSGFEGKTTWTHYQQINDYIAKLDPPGRVMVEHAQKVDEFGTPRAFELIPYWTGLPTMEGTLMEASFTAPFHFINQAELSKEASDAIIGVRYPSLNIAQGLTHLQLMNIPYLLTVTPDAATQVMADPRADLLANFGDYNIFRIAGSTGYVQVMANEPVRLKVAQKDWRDAIVNWYLNPPDLTTPVVFDQGEAALQKFASITANGVTNPPKVPVQTDGTVTNEVLGNETLSFDTTAIGEPHWIKISYFPNWHVKGAEGPYLVSPSFMMVIPTQSHVTLYYGRTTANTVGQTFEVIGWLVLIGLSVWRFLLWRRRRRAPKSGGGDMLPVGPAPGYGARLSGTDASGFPTQTISWPDFEPGARSDPAAKAREPQEELPDASPEPADALDDREALE